MDQKYIFISGAAGGIGKANSLFFAENNYYVFAADRSDVIFNCFSHAKIFPLKLDITCPDSIEKAVGEIKSRTSHINGIVNIAGMFDQFPLVEAKPDAFEKLINVNMIGHQSITRALFPLLLKAKGRVINLSSETVYAQMPLQAYAFSKKLFDVWNTQLRLELALLGIKVVVVRAGGHQTPFIDRSVDVIGDVDTKSLYGKLMLHIKDQARRMLLKPQSDPAILAKVFLKAMVVKKPKQYYDVNVSNLFRILSFLPSGMREFFMIRHLKKWI